MIHALPLLVETCQVVMFMISAHEAGHHFAGPVQHAVGYAKAQLAGIEVLDGLDVASRQRQVLDRPADTLQRPYLLGLRQSEDDRVAVRISHRKRSPIEQRCLPVAWSQPLLLSPLTQPIERRLIANCPTGMGELFR